MSAVSKPDFRLPRGMRHESAQADEECIRCAYPFDAGDRIVVDDRNPDGPDAVFCSFNCAMNSRDGS